VSPFLHHEGQDKFFETLQILRHFKNTLNREEMKSKTNRVAAQTKQTYGARQKQQTTVKATNSKPIKHDANSSQEFLTYAVHKARFSVLPQFIIS
jgi:hypothetical protein